MVYAAGRLTEPGTRVALVTDDPEEAHRSPAEITVLAPLGSACSELVHRVQARPEAGPAPRVPPRPLSPPGAGEPFLAGHVLAALGERLPRDAIVVEEAPADRPESNARLPAREPLGYLSAAMGGLGFALPGATGVRMALPSRPVVAVVGDGSAIYCIQALWSATRYGVGALFVILSNGGYAVMDIIAELHGAPGPWPAFPELEIAAVARGFGCPARRISTHAELVDALDEVVPTLATRTEPLLLDVAIAPTRTFEY